MRLMVSKEDSSHEILTPVFGAEEEKHYISCLLIL